MHATLDNSLALEQSADEVSSHLNDAAHSLSLHQPLTERLMIKLGLDFQDAISLHDDLIRFLNLCVQVPAQHRSKLSPPTMIDYAWHEALMFTHWYQSYCLSHFGRMVHHTPYTLAEKAVRKAQGADEQSRQYTLLFARQVYGVLSNNWLNQTTNDCGGCH